MAMLMEPLMKSVSDVSSGTVYHLHATGKTKLKSDVETVQPDHRRLDRPASATTSSLGDWGMLSAKDIAQAATLFAWQMRRQLSDVPGSEFVDLAWNLSKLGTHGSAWFVCIALETLQAASRLMSSSLVLLAAAQPGSNASDQETAQPLEDSSEPRQVLPV